MARNEYSHYKLCVCSHLRLVCYTTGHEWKGEYTEGPAHGPGWYHISPDGTLENFGQPCQADVHRFDFEWPDNAIRLDHMLVELQDESDERPEPTPRTTTIAEKYSK